MDKPQKKYRLTTEPKMWLDLKSYRIEEVTSLISLGSVKAGDAWASDDAAVAPLTITGLTYQVTITDTQMRIGCECHPITEWRDFDDRRIAEMDGKKGLKFWNDHKAHLLGLCDATGRPLAVETETGDAT